MVVRKGGCLLVGSERVDIFFYYFSMVVREGGFFFVSEVPLFWAGVLVSINAARTAPAETWQACVRWRRISYLPLL